MYLDFFSIDDLNYYFVIDIFNLVVYIKVVVLIFLEDGDIVQVKGIRNVIWYGKVCEVDLEVYFLKVQWYQEIRRYGVWILLFNVDRICFGFFIGFV